MQTKFHLNEKSTIRAFREFKDLRDSSKIPTLNTLLELQFQLFLYVHQNVKDHLVPMNTIIGYKRNAVFISCAVPHIKLFKPDRYVKSCDKLCKNSAEETRCPKRDEQDIDRLYQHLWAY